MRALTKKSFSKISKIAAFLLCLVMLVSAANFGAIFPSIVKAFASSAEQTQIAPLNEEQPQFTPLDYTIKLDYQGGYRKEGDAKLTEGKLEITGNREVTVAPPIKEDYAFYGFFNKDGKKYFNDQGKICEDIVFTVNNPEVLYASWVKISSNKVTLNGNGMHLWAGEGYKYTTYDDIGLDIAKLSELRFAQIQVDFAIDCKVYNAGNDRSLLLQIDPSGTVWTNDEVYLENTKWETKYYSAAISTEKFKSNSRFRLGFKQSDINSYWSEFWFNKAEVYFTAIEQQPAEPLTSDSKKLNTKAYEIRDNNYYNIDEAISTSHPLGKNYAEISLRFKGGTILEGGNNSFGYVTDNNFSGEDSPALELALKYNFDTAENIAKVSGSNEKWSISKDTWSGSIDGITGAGVVNSGALLVQKSKDGEDWNWENPRNNGTVQSFHSTDFVNNYSPKIFNGKSNMRMQYAPVEKRNPDGSYVYTRDEKDNITGVEYDEKDGHTLVKESHFPTDGYLPIYHPSGIDLKNGIYIRVLFAYELSYYDYKNGWSEFWDGFFSDTKQWHYINVVEETILYIANSNGNILIQNMNFSTSADSNPEINNATSGLVRQFGTVKNGHSVNDGFKVNFNGNTSYEVSYKKNDADEAPVTDGQVFLEPGKYDIHVKPKIGPEKITTIYINERGMAQNFYQYFGDNLITSDSERVYSPGDAVPVYKAGKTWWSTKEVDAYRTPVAGKVGQYIEGLSKKELNTKYAIKYPAEPAKIKNESSRTYTLRSGGTQEYFVINSRVEVDSNYISTPNDGFTSYRDYVSDKYERKVGDGFEALKEPFEKDGVKYVGTIYTTRTDENNKTIIGTIDGYEVYKVVSQKTNNSKSSYTSPAITESGFYIGIFANNPDYFNNVELSGDIYSFTFQFIVSDYSELPSVNKNFFGMNLGFSDYQSKYYGVSIPSANKNASGKNFTATFVYYDYASAFTCAYEYSRSLVTFNNKDYYFNGDTDNSFSQSEIMKKVNEYAKDMVNPDCYFDGSNPSSYLTYKGLLNDEALANLKHDVMVFDSSLANHFYTIGTPFLNNRAYSYIDETGEITSGENEMRFIQVSDFESSSIELIYTANENIRYNDLPYGAAIQTFLEGKNAPSGKYRIVEKNKCYDGSKETETIYYGVYLRKGDNNTKIDITRTNGANATKQTLSRAYANTTFTVNSFIINSASNELDPYGIVKVTNKSGYNKTYQLDEVDNIVIETQGEWTISLVDRLGNAVRFYVNIYTPSEVHSLTLVNNGVQYSKQLAAGGERIYLDRLTSNELNLVFKGWADIQGNIYNDNFLFGFTKDTTLTAVWHFSSTTVSIYDGTEIVPPKETKAGEKIEDLPNPTRPGYELYGFKYILDGQTRFCIGQLNSVPNVPSLRLDAVWIDMSEHATKEQLNSTPSKPGMIFYGWATAERGANAKIFTKDTVDAATFESLTLYALYISDGTVQQSQSAGAGTFKTALNGFLGGLGAFFADAASNGSLFIGLALIMLCVAFILFKNRKRAFGTMLNSNVITESVANNMNQDNVLQTERKLVFASECGVGTASQSVYTYKKEKLCMPRRRINWKSLITPAICCMLVLVLSATFSQKLLYGIRQKYDMHVQEVAIQRQMDDYKEQVKLANEAKEAEIEKRDNYTAQTSTAFAESQNINLNNNDINDRDAFLYSVVYFDLLSLDYDVFPATVQTNNGIIKGFAYISTTSKECYSKKGSDRVFFGTGFVSLLGEPSLAGSDIENGLEIKPILEDGEEESTEYGYILSFEDQLLESHYIAYGKYTIYSIKNYAFDVAFKDNVYENYDISLGYLYDYDSNSAVYDPDLGKSFDKSGYSLVSEFDYEEALEMLVSKIAEQDSAAVTIETYTMTVISIEALQEYLLHNQDERYLGVSADELYFYESQLGAVQFYYIDGQTGAVNVLTLPEDTGNNVVWWRVALAAVTLAAGAVMLFVPGMQAFGALTIASGAAQVADLCGATGLAKVLNIATTIAASIVTMNPMPLMLMAMSEAGGGHLATGLGFASAGAGSISVGIASFGNGPVGIVLGIINIALGVVDLGFAANEIAWEFTGTNFMQEWFNMSDELYYALGAAAMTATTVMIVASSVYGMRYQSKQSQPEPEEKSQQQQKEPSKKEIKEMRKAAAEKAKAQEMELLKKQQKYVDENGTLPDGSNPIKGKWGSGALTYEEAQWVLKNNRFPSYKSGDGWQIDGHHIKSVDLAKQQGDYASIGNPDNIAVGNRSLHKQWHNGDWTNHSSPVIIGNKPVTTINRTQMLNDIKINFGGK